MFLQVCPVCEHRNPRGSRFCNECGSPLQLRFCPQCHAAEDVMSLECRTCGTKLPMLIVTDAPAASVAPPVIAPPPESIFKTASPAPLPPADFSETDDEAVTVHGEAGAPPSMAALFAGEPAPLNGKDASSTGTDDGFAAHAPQEGEPPRQAKRRARTSKNKRPTIIELLHDTPTGLELPPDTAPEAPVPSAETAPENVDADSPTEGAAAPPTQTEGEPARKKKSKEPPILFDMVGEPTEQDANAQPVALNAESASEIEVSAEAETLVEASVAPVIYNAPEEIAIAEPVQPNQFDDIATQLREGAWRRAMSADTSVDGWTPAVIYSRPPPQRRLDLRRVGLLALALGVAAVAIYSVRLSPGTGPVATQVASTPAEQAAAPSAQPAAESAPASQPSQTGSVVAPSTPLDAKVIEPAAAAAMPVAAPLPVEEKTAPAAEHTVAPPRAEPAPATKAPLARVAPATAQAPSASQVDIAPRATLARRMPVEVPRPCTAAVAALNLCTPEAGKEGN